MKKWIALCLALLCAGLLCACQGKPLPDGMSEDTLLQKGQEVLLELVEGDYDAVYGYLPGGDPGVGPAAAGRRGGV